MQRRRRQNYKFHAIAIAIICAVITALYMLIGPGPSAVDSNSMARGDQYIQIYNATWGQNCNPSIQQAMKTQRPAATPEEAAKHPRLEPVVTDNVLLTVGDRCNGRLQCGIPASVEVLGIDPLKSCFKRLNVGYRCFSYDRLWIREAGQGEVLQIDCSKPQEDTKKSK